MQDVINSNKSLDLPTQQELLAQHRCEEAISEIFIDLTGKLQDLYKFIECDELDKVTNNLKLFVEAANSEYFEKLHRYPIHVVQLKSDSLQRRIKEVVEPLFHAYCKRIEKKSLKIFELDLKSSSKKFSESSLKESTQRAIIFYRASIQGTTK